MAVAMLGAGAPSGEVFTVLSKPIAPAAAAAAFFACVALGRAWANAGGAGGGGGAAGAEPPPKDIKTLLNCTLRRGYASTATVSPEFSCERVEVGRRLRSGPIELTGVHLAGIGRHHGKINAGNG